MVFPVRPIDDNPMHSRERAEELRSTWAGMQESGINSLLGAVALNREEIRAPRGAEWSAVQVNLVLARLNQFA